MTSSGRFSPIHLATSAAKLCAGLHEEKADDDDDEVEVSEVEVSEIGTENLSELLEVQEITKERPLSVNTLHLLASATLKRAGRQFEYVRKEVVDNSASAGPPRRGQTVCGGSSVPQQGDARDDALHDGVVWRRELAKLLGNICTPTARPSAMHELERLHDDEYVRGNVRKYPSGITLPIDVEAADAIRQGRRQQRAGLCYEEHGFDEHGFDGFSFCTWPHVFAAPANGSGHHDAMLHGPRGIADATRVSVIYEATPDPKLVGVAKVFWDAHKICRETDPSAGGMVGVGEHLRRDGHVANFVVTDAAARARVAAGMEQAGQAFGRRWTGAGVEYEQLLENQDRLWGAKSRRWPLCWDMSDGLGNAMHVDPDGHRSYAVWLSALGHAGASRSWYLLFPRHGLAIELCHGCWISWDGRVQPHCTAVPDVAEGDRLMSLFCSLPANAMNVLERANSWRDVMHERQAPIVPGVRDRVLRGRELFDYLAKDMDVVYSFVKEAPDHLLSKAAKIAWGKEKTRYCRGKVVGKTTTHVTILDSNGTTSVRLSVAEVNNRLWLP